MDEELKPLLRDIATERRARNELIREQQRKSDEARDQLLSQMNKGMNEARAEFNFGPDFASINRHHDETMQRLKDGAERERAERTDFQQAILAEIRQLNANLEALLKKQ